MSWKSTTGMLIILAVGVLVIYDTVAFLNGGPEVTISRVILKASIDNPAIPFAGGFLCGHLFWKN